MQIFLIALVLFIPIAGVILGAMALAQSSRVSKRLENLERELAALRREGPPERAPAASRATVQPTFL